MGSNLIGKVDKQNILLILCGFKSHGFISAGESTYVYLPAAPEGGAAPRFQWGAIYFYKINLNIIRCLLGY